MSNKGVFGILLLLGVASASYNGNLTLNISHGSTLDFNTTGQVINGTWFMLFNFTPNASLTYNFSYAVDGVWRVFPDTGTTLHPFGAIASGGGTTTNITNNITNNYTTSYNFTNDTTTNASTYLVLVNGTGNQTPFMSNYLSFNPLQRRLTVYQTATSLPNSAESSGNQYLLFHSLQNGYSSLKTINNIYAAAGTGTLYASNFAGGGALLTGVNYNHYFGGMYLSTSPTTITPSAAQTWDEITSGFSVSYERGCTFQNTHEIQLGRPGFYKVDWSITLAGKGGEYIRGTITENGVAKPGLVAGTFTYADGQQENMGGTGIISVSADDVIALAIWNDASTNDINIIESSLSVVYLSEP